MSMMVSPYWFGAVSSAAKYVTNENTGTTTEAAGTMTDMADLGTVDLEAASNYFGVFSMDALNSGTTGTTQSRVLVNGSTIHTAATLVNDVRAATEYRSHAGIFFIQNAGGATTATVKLQGARRTTGTATFKNRRLSLMKMGANDAIAESIAAQSFTNTTTNKTAQTVATLSFTPPSSGDYIIMCSLMPNLTSASNVAFGVQLSDGTNSTTELKIRPEGGSQEPIVLVWPRTALSGAQSFTLKIRQTGTGLATIRCAEIRICAIREDRFANVYKTRLGSTSAGTETAYTTALTQTFTPAAADHITLASWMQESTFGNQATVKYDDGGTAVDELLTQDGVSSAGNANVPGFSHRLTAYAASSRTQTIQRKVNAGTSRVYVESQIVTFDLTGLT